MTQRLTSTVWLHTLYMRTFAISASRVHIMCTRALSSRETPLCFRARSLSLAVPPLCVARCRSVCWNEFVSKSAHLSHAPPPRPPLPPHPPPPTCSYSCIAASTHLTAATSLCWIHSLTGLSTYLPRYIAIMYNAIMNIANSYLFVFVCVCMCVCVCTRVCVLSCVTVMCAKGFGVVRVWGERESHTKGE